MTIQTFRGGITMLLGTLLCLSLVFAQDSPSNTPVPANTVEKKAESDQPSSETAETTLENTPEVPESHRANAFGIKKSESKRSPKTTTEEGSQRPSTVKIFKLTNADAMECVNILRSLSFSRGLGIAADKRTNAIIVEVRSQDSLKLFEAFMTEFDSMPTIQKPKAMRAAVRPSLKGDDDWYQSPPEKMPEADSKLKAANVGTSEKAALIDELKGYEDQAELLAQQIRKPKSESSGSGSSDIEAVKNHQAELQEELDTTLTNALMTKFKLETLQIKEIEDRVGLLKLQISLRQNSVKQIVNRRARELISGSSTEWTPAEPVAKPALISAGEGRIPLNVAENIRALKAHRPGFCTEDGPPEMNKKLDAIVEAAAADNPVEFEKAVDAAIECVVSYKMHNYNRQRHPKSDVLTMLNALKDGYSDIREIPFYKFVTSTGEKRMGLPGLKYASERSEAEPVN